MSNTQQALPAEVNIMGIVYKVEYVDKPSEVDIFKRESLWGQIDYWTRTIRVYANNRTREDIWQTIIHEVLHGIANDLHLKFLDASDKEKHNELDILALALADILFRNGWMKP
jgi:hypothetical protein